MRFWVPFIALKKICIYLETSEFKKIFAARQRWLTPIILATWEAEIRKITV
jgi:hypothetical protein